MVFGTQIGIRKFRFQVDTILRLWYVVCSMIYIIYLLWGAIGKIELLIVHMGAELMRSKHT